MRAEQNDSELDIEPISQDVDETPETEPAEAAPDPTGASDPMDALSATVTALQATLSEERALREKAETDYRYLQAEFVNFRRRKQEEFDGQQKYLSAELLKGLLPILDNFERALQAAEQHQSYEKLIGGVQGTHKQLMSFLEKAGVQPIAAVGQEFNPQFHEAIGHAEGSDLPANTVAEEVQRGYTIHDRVLRPALVKVSAG
jgi:molecular chaperone GrpE